MNKHRFSPLLPIAALCSLVLHSCSSYDADSYSYNKSSIYSESDKVLFSEVIFFVKPYVVDAGQRKYVVTDTLKNVSLKINNKIERTSDSYSLDIEHLAKETLGDYQVTAQNIHYPVVMGVTMIPEELTTAGQYADLLNNYMNLQPGVYVCQIVSFDIKTASGALKRVYTPTISFSLEVKENMLSADLGEFEVEIK